MKNSKNKYLILGGDSNLGKTIKNYFKKNNINFISTTRNKKKISKYNIFFDFEQSKNFIIPEKISTVYFCASITSIENCEKEKKKTKDINVNKTCDLIKIFLKKNIYVVYFSTNLIFSGSRKYFSYLSKYAPQNEYAKQKILVEKFLQRQKIKNFTIIRFGKIIFKKDKVLNKWINNLNKNKNILVIKNRSISPIYIKDAFEVIKKITLNHKLGIFQISASDSISYLDIANFVAKILKKNKNLIKIINSNSLQNSILKSNFEFDKRIISADTLKYFLNDNNIF